MTDEQKKTSPDDEYQFPQEEYAVTHQDAPAAENPFAGPAGPAGADVKSRGPVGKLFDSARSMPSLKNKRIVIVVLVVILAIIFFRVLNSHKTTPPLVQPQPAAQEAPAQQVAPVPQPVDDTSMASLDTLKPQPPHAESAKLRDLKGQVADMQSSLAQAQTQNEQLQKSVTTLTAQVQALTSQLNSLLAAKKGPQAPVVVYHLRAIVPDRAWIISNSGDTSTVRVGDKLEQYGTIQSIDAVHGVIQTSSGRKIGYGINDV